MKRLKLAAALAVALGAAACAPPEAGGRVLRVANWNGAGDDGEYARAVRDVLQEFEAAHPGVEIQLEGIPGSQNYVRKMLLAHVAGAEPDVLTLDASSAAAFIDNGLLRDLAPLIAADPALEEADFFPPTLEVTKRGRANFGVPLDFTPMVVYYNLTHFEEAGIEPPKPGWTWDDFLAKAKALTRDGRSGYAFTNWMPGWLMWVWNNGGDALGPDGRARGALDSPETAEAVGWLAALVNEHKAAPSLSAMAAQGVDPFLSGRASMTVSGHWNLVSVREAPALKGQEIGVAEMPAARAGEPSRTVIYQSSLAISKRSRQPDLAWAFVRHMASAAVQRRLQSTGLAVCARRDIAREMAVDAREREFLRIIPSARPPWGSKVMGYDLVESEGQAAMDKVLKLGMEPRQALSEAAARIDQLMERGP